MGGNMKVIFLDIDGVLNSFDNMYALRFIDYNNGPLDRDRYGVFFDERCVRWLRLILHETKAKIVISSAWKDSGLKVMQAMWQERKLPGEVIDITPDALDIMDESRGREIQMWLDKHEVESYCIIDDNSDMLPEQMKYFVQTESVVGLNRESYRQANFILNMEENE
jgi:hypothetical protein